ncbi:ABC transporter ATP-binding protein [Corynebacterium casei]|uniref:ABC transporter ATP-binding protein n=1 Tax=Corynebacterium casei TaxID=160386 RepID=UPI003FD1B3D9
MRSSSDPTVVAREISKQFRVNMKGHRKKSSLQRRAAVQALQKLSFATYAGESIGVLGRNGSGKSTLMSLLAGNVAPTTGEIYVRERPTLLSVGAALKKDLTGLENARLGLLAQGFSKAQADEKYREVAEWAEIDDAIYRPYDTYSSGMKARLKFSIATAGFPTILLVDEALATGDAAFNRKAKDRMGEFLDNAGTVFIVSHSASTIRSHCNRAMWLNEGELLADGDVADTSSTYRRWSKALTDRDRTKASQAIRHARRLYESQRLILDSEAAIELQ